MTTYQYTDQYFPLAIPSPAKCAALENYVRKNFAESDVIYTTWDKNTGETLVYPYKPPHNYPLTIYTATAAEYSGNALAKACQKWADKWQDKTKYA